MLVEVCCDCDEWIVVDVGSAVWRGLLLLLDSLSLLSAGEAKSDGVSPPGKLVSAERRTSSA